MYTMANKLLFLASKCMMMAAIAYNLKKVMKFKTNKPMAATAAMCISAIINLR